MGKIATRIESKSLFRSTNQCGGVSADSVYVLTARPSYPRIVTDTEVGLGCRLNCVPHTRSQVIHKRTSMLLPIVVAASMVLASCSSDSSDESAAESSPAAEPCTGPVISDGGSVLLQLNYPGAQAVSVEGSWGEFSKTVEAPLTNDGKGCWTAQLNGLEPDAYEYTFTVEEKEVADPAGTQYVQDAESATRTFVVPGEGAELVTPTEGSAGEYHTVQYLNKATGETRELTVWTPPGYSEDADPYPTLYSAGGLQRVNENRVGVQIGRMIEEGMMAPVVLVVSPIETSGRSYWPPTMDQSPQNWKDSIIPTVEEQFNVDPDPAARAVMGFSSGGVQAMSAYIYQPGLFGKVGSFSGGFNKNTFATDPYLGTDPVADIAASGVLDPAVHNAKTDLLMVATGTEDIAYKATVNTTQMLVGAGLDVTSWFAPALAHNSAANRVYIERFAAEAFPA
jgi:enterochelin esterase-like enzyme